MAYFPQFLGLLILVCSATLMQTQGAGIRSNDSTILNMHPEIRVKREEEVQSTRQRAYKVTKIFFPVEDEEVTIDNRSSEVTKFVPSFVKNVPECANEGRTFCENVDHYPSFYIENMLKKDSVQFRGMFGQDVVKDFSTLSHRIDQSEEYKLCASVENVVFPQTAKNQDDKWMFVVNHGDYKQGVRVETCKAKDGTASCRFTKGFPLGYNTTCRQKFIYRRLIALGEDGKTKTDIFQLPSCCSCIVSSNGISPGRMEAYARLKLKTTQTNEGANND